MPLHPLGCYVLLSVSVSVSVSVPVSLSLSLSLSLSVNKITQIAVDELLFMIFWTGGMHDKQQPVRFTHMVVLNCT